MSTDNMSALALSQLAGSKHRKQQLSSGVFQEHLAAPPSDFARKQLEKMGWKQGTGLGKKRDGIKSHIKVQKRQENAGLGIDKQTAILQAQKEGEEWWKNSLGDTLAKLSSKKKSSSNRKSDKEQDNKRSRKQFTDEELFEATGGARFGMRAGKSRNLAKWKRAESELSSTTASTAPESNSSGSDTNPGDSCVTTERAEQDDSKEKTAKSDKKKKRKRKEEKSEEATCKKDRKSKKAKQAK